MLSFDPESKIVLVEEDPRKIPKRYSVSQVKPYMTETEPDATEYMQTVKKAISNFNSKNNVNETRGHDDRPIKERETEKNERNCRGRET